MFDTSSLNKMRISGKGAEKKGEKNAGKKRAAAGGGAGGGDAAKKKTRTKR